MKKSSKRFTLSTEATNSLGFKVRTSGIDLSDFNKNPLLLWMHKRPKGERQDEVLPLGYWGDIELKDGKITAVPYFDETDPFSMKIYNKVENGTIKMASAGLKPIEFAETSGEKWLEKSSLQEGSLCDIGSNKEALSVALYNDDNELIKLADFNQTLNSNKTDMKLIQLSADQVLPLLKLKEDANAAEAQTALLNLVTLAESQKTEIDTLKTEKTDLQKKLDDAEEAGQKEKVVALVDKAIEDRKITADQKPSMIKLAEADYESTKGYLEGLTAAPTVQSQVGKDKADDALVNLTWDQLDKQGKLVQLKEQDVESFKEKYKQKFGSEYKSK